MSRPVFLSYPFEKDFPVFGGRARVEASTVKDMDRGDSCNVYRLTLDNHWGTHIDAPNHFFREGRAVCDYPPEFFVFSHPFVIDVDLKEAEILGVTDTIRAIPLDTDLVLFRSGWGRFRDEEKYVKRNPGLSPDIGRFLRSCRPSVRAVGMDWISTSSFADRETGRLAHAAFLDPRGQGYPVLLIEDMLLPQNIVSFTEVIVAPLMVRGIDSAPCTVIGRIHA
jgi:kynurenine formamidase